MHLNAGAMCLWHDVLPSHSASPWAKKAADVARDQFRGGRSQGWTGVPAPLALERYKLTPESRNLHTKDSYRIKDVMGNVGGTPDTRPCH